MKLTEDAIKRRINKIISKDSEKYWKYERNFQYYTNTKALSLKDATQTLGYNANLMNNTTSVVRENIIFNTISALVSKIAEHTKARAYINTIKGNFEDIQVAKAAQQYFDIIFDQQNIYHIISMAFRDACIFERGWVFVDKDNKKLKNVLPWEIYVDGNEIVRNEPIKQIVWKQDKFPVINLPDDIDTSEVTRDEVTFIRYWNSKDHVTATVIPELRYVKVDAWENDVVPFLTITYDDPISTKSTTSVVDLLYSIQRQVDSILDKISEAVDRSLVNIITIPNNSNIKDEKMSNKVAQIIRYDFTSEMTGNPVGIQTPAPIDGSYINLLNKFTDDAYQMVGISELSVTSQKPTGLDSGKALQSLENIEADRFQLQVNKVVHMYDEVARICTELFDGSILPVSNDRMKLSWKLLRKINEKMTIQFTAVDNESKLPSGKSTEIQNLAKSGFLPVNRVPMLMYTPDLEQAYSFAMNAYNAIQTVIWDCVKEDKYKIDPYIPLEELKPEIMNTCLLLKSLGGEDNERDIKKLLKLYKEADRMEAEVGQAESMDQASSELDAISNEMDYGTQQMDMQAQQMTSIANDLQNGQIDVEQANELLQNMAALETNY
jgi:hypothetical protein